MGTYVTHTKALAPAIHLADIATFKCEMVFLKKNLVFIIHTSKHSDEVNTFFLSRLLSNLEKKNLQINAFITFTSDVK